MNRIWALNSIHSVQCNENCIIKTVKSLIAKRKKKLFRLTNGKNRNFTSQSKILFEFYLMQCTYKKIVVHFYLVYVFLLLLLLLVVVLLRSKNINNNYKLTISEKNLYNFQQYHFQFQLYPHTAIQFT